MMAEETSKEPETEDKLKRKFNQEQYEMLKRCSDKKGMSEWNEWRRGHPGTDIELEGQDFSTWYLQCAFLNSDSGVIYDEKTPDVEAVKLTGKVYLKEAVFLGAKLQKAELCGTHLERVDFGLAHLENATLLAARLEGAILCRCYLEGANFDRTVVDGSTLIWECKVNRHCSKEKGTDFEGVALDSARIDPGTKQLLEYNIRRKNWEDWYKEHPRLKWLVKLFWWISDYGLSTKRIIFTFFGLAIIFANIYYYWGRIAPPGIVGNLFIDRTSVVIPWQLVPLRTLYFSIVTMTTLGFGDMYAYPTSWFGHILLMVQVILGYVLLGALVTRFAVLFTAGGPVGKFADE